MNEMQFSDTLSHHVEWNCESYEKIYGVQVM